MGNTAFSQPIQSNVQDLVISETEMTTLILHNDTLTYILISLGIDLGVLIYFYQKYQQ